MKNKKVKDIIRTDNSGKDPRFPLGVLGYQVSLSNSSHTGKKAGFYTNSIQICSGVSFSLTLKYFRAQVGFCATRFAQTRR